MLLFPIAVIDDTCTESQTTRVHLKSVIYLNYIGISPISSCKACPRQYILLPPTRSPAVNTHFSTLLQHTSIYHDIPCCYLNIAQCNRTLLRL